MRLLRLFYVARAALARTFPLMRDSRVPLALKAGAVALGILVVSPIDVFSDIPVLGVMDDAALLVLLCVWFVRLAAKHVEPVPVWVRSGPKPGSSLAVR